MDPVQKHWMLENWLEDIRDSSELAKNHAYLLASFSHPEQVKRMMGEGIETHQSTDEEFAESIRMVKEINEKKNVNKIKVKKRRQLR
jgi:hypothetical protein